MRRANFSFLTSAALLIGALLWLAIGNGAGGFFWVLLSLVWFIVSVFQLVRHDTTKVTDPRRTFGRRFLRFILYWS
jgi:hypothetical protein